MGPEEGGRQGRRKKGGEGEREKGEAGRALHPPPIGLGESGQGPGAEGEGEGPCVPTSPAGPPCACTRPPSFSPLAPSPARLGGREPRPTFLSFSPQGAAPPSNTPPPAPPGLSFQSSQIVTLEKELRQGQVCFSLEVSKESNLLLRSTADVSGASAPQAELRTLGRERRRPRAAGAGGRAALERAFQGLAAQGRFLELTEIFLETEICVA